MSSSLQVTLAAVLPACLSPARCLPPPQPAWLRQSTAVLHSPAAGGLGIVWALLGGGVCNPLVKHVGGVHQAPHSEAVGAGGDDAAALCQLYSALLLPLEGLRQVAGAVWWVGERVWCGGQERNAAAQSERAQRRHAWLPGRQGRLLPPSLHIPLRPCPLPPPFPLTHTTHQGAVG